MRYSATVDVPDLRAGIAFHGGAFGFRELARPVAAFAVLAANGRSPGLMQKEEGTRATPAAGTERRYAGHRTPVHLDFHVEDFEGARAAVEGGGGAVEQVHALPGRPPVAFCADPWGNGFCLIGPPP